MAAAASLLMLLMVAGIAVFVSRRTVPERPEPVSASTPAAFETAAPVPAPGTQPPSPAPVTPSPSPSPSPAAPAPSAEPVQVKLPYCITVDRGRQVVTVYTIGASGKYDVVARQMICSTDKTGKHPGNGIYRMNGHRKRWVATVGNTYAQYATRISGSILFHSVPYTKERPNALEAEEYEKLGKNASQGCVRLACEDAKWIYENVPRGTLVKFRTGTYSAEEIERLKPPALGTGKWDPTDDAADNPDYIGASYHADAAATPYPGVTPSPTSHRTKTWKYRW